MPHDAILSLKGDGCIHGEAFLKWRGSTIFLTTDKPVMCRPCVPPMPEKAVAKVQDIPTPIALEAFNPCKCRARVFGSGAKKAMGPQCTRKKVDGQEYCKKHTAELEREKRRVISCHSVTMMNLGLVLD